MAFPAAAPHRKPGTVFEIPRKILSLYQYFYDFQTFLSAR